MVDIVIDGLSCQYVRADDRKLHRILLEGLCVEDVVFLWYDVVAEFSIEIVSAAQQGAQSAVTRILSETRIVSNGPSNLSRLDVATKCCTSRHANQSVGPDVVLHHHVGHASRP